MKRPAWSAHLAPVVIALLVASCATSTGTGDEPGDAGAADSAGADASADIGGIDAGADAGGADDVGADTTQDAEDTGGTDTADGGTDAGSDAGGVCGDGVVDDGEQCDAGDANGTDGEPCTQACIIDADRDGADAGTDCDDEDAGRTPGADELCDGVDNDCDGGVDEDTVDVEVCALPSIDLFELSQERVAPGGTVSLTWEVSAADEVRIDADPVDAAPGAVDASGVAALTITADTTFTLVATSTLGTASLDRTVTVVPPLLITTPAEGDDTLPAAATGVRYSFTFEAVGGAPPLTWAAFEDLPDELSLDDETGELTGTFVAEGEHVFDVAVTDALAESQEDVRTVTLRVLPPAATIDTTSLPDAAVSELYVARLEASGGIEPLAWSAEGLPAGLSISGASIVGTPTTPGTTDVTLTVTDRGARATSATLPLTVLPPGPALVTTALPWAVELQSYSAMIEATAGTPPYTFSVSSGEFPAGLVLADDGTVSGVPTEAGAATVRILVTDDTGATGLGVVTIEVDAALNIASASWPLAEVGAPYDAAIEVTGGLAPYTWEALSDVPDGLAADADVLRLVGTPTTEGPTFVNVRVADSRPTPQVIETTLNLRIAPAGPTITTATLPPASVGVAYSTTVEATGGTPPLTWSGAGLPDGLELDETTGVISGTPVTIFDGEVTIDVEDADGRVASATYPLAVVADELFIVTTAVPAASTGSPYTFGLEAAGGVPPYSWRIVLGGLPVGIDLAADGTISGTTAAIGSSSFTVRVTDADGAGVNAAFTLDVLAGLRVINESLPDGAVGRAYAELLEVDNASGEVTWELVEGAFPEGVVLLDDGTIFGTPTEAGPFTVTVRATDAGSLRTIEATFSFEVLELPTEFGVLHGSFTDISAVGTRLDISDSDDAASPATPIGFPFTFYGTEFTELYVSTNGTVSFGAATTDLGPGPLPDELQPTNLIAVFWDDLDPGDAGDIYVHTLGAEPTRRFVVQWKDVDFFTGDNSRINAQAILYEGTNQVQLLYGNSQQGSAVIEFGAVGGDVGAGIQNGDATDGVMLSDIAERNLLPGTVGLFTPAGDTYTLETWTRPVSEWTEIGDTGTVSTATGDDASQTVPIGFTFDFWGASQTDLTLSTNGYLTFGGLGTTFSNAAIPTAGGPEALIAPFWDDLATGDGRIVYQTVGEAPFRRFIVQWDGVQRLGDSTGVLYFQAVLHETSNAISFHYAELAGGSIGFLGESATIGIENPDGTDGVQISFIEEAVHQGDSLWILPRWGTDTSQYVASTPAPGFDDIRAVGMPVPVTADDASADVSIGFETTYYGEVFDTISVGSNGFASFTSAANETGGALGDGSAPSGVLAPFWDDLYPPGSNELLGIWSATLGEPGNRRFVVQWQSMPHFADRTASLTFQLTLYEADGAVEYRYGGLRGGTNTLQTGRSATIGLDSPDGSSATVFGEDVERGIGAGSWVRLTPR